MKRIINNKKSVIPLLLILIILLTACACVKIANSIDTEPETQTEPEQYDIETIVDDADNEDFVVAQMAGFWRMDYPNPVNAQIMILSEDGSWESPGPLTTDSTMGGSFVIVDVDSESGFYNLLFTIEHSDNAYNEIGQEMDGYVFDVQNDRIGLWLGSEEGVNITWFIRELTPGDSIDRAALNDNFHKEFYTANEEGRLVFHEDIFNEYVEYLNNSQDE